MADGQAVSIVVPGSVNLDIVALAEKLPVAGETVTNATLNRYPGGKGANQALAAQRLGAQVSLHACVGDDAAATEALALLKEGGVDLSGCRVDAQAATGTGLIVVDAEGNNQIVVASGANRCLDAESLLLPEADALLCQLEVPMAVLERAAERFKGMLCLNLAPARDIPGVLLDRAALVVVNEIEAEFYGERLARCPGFVATTFGAAGASLSKGGEIVARSESLVVDAIDTTGAGDTFTAALSVALIEGMAPSRALAFACAAGALATTKSGAQPSLPFRAEVDAALDNWKPE